MALRVDEEQTVAVFLISGRKGSCMPRLLLGAAALALVLAGCGGDPESTPSPEVTLTTPVDASASASPAPTLPAAAQADTKAGAIAFVKHYVELINHLQATGDADPMMRVSRPDCRSCAAATEAARQIYEHGGRVEGGAWTIDSAHATKPAAAVWTVRVEGHLAPSNVLRTNADPNPGSGGEADAEFVLMFDRGWEVVQWQTL